MIKLFKKLFGIKPKETNTNNTSWEERSIKQRGKVYDHDPLLGSMEYYKA